MPVPRRPFRYMLLRTESHLRTTCISICLLCSAALGAAQEQGGLKAGAARIEITPAADTSLPMSGYANRGPHEGVHDSLYVRALVLDDGTRQAAIITGDLIGIPETLWAQTTQRLVESTGIPLERILLVGTHTHGAPTPAPPKGEVASAHAAWLSRLSDSIVQAVKTAQASRRPARVGYGTGRANVNVNRRARTSQGGWWLGVNPDGPSDKTVGVIKVETPAGLPIALFVNYSVHGTVMGPANRQITGDLPGVTSRYLEQHFGEDLVALWTSGAAGDQNAIYGPGSDFRQAEILGRILGEEVVRIAAEIQATPRARLLARQTIVTCPGQTTPPGVHASRDLDIRFEEGPPVDIRLSLLMIDHIAFAGVSGEVLTRIGERLRKESPFMQLMLVTHTNGSSGYLPDDDAYRQVSYEITAAKVRRGCAEKAIVDGLLGLMRPQ